MLSAMDENNANHFVTPDQLRIGLYVHLDLSWMDHPFKFNNFRISNKAEIAQLRALGLKRLRYDPLRSDEHRRETEAADQARDVAPAPDIVDDAAPPEPHHTTDRERRLQALHLAMHECERKFIETTREAKRIERDLRASATRAAHDAQVLIDDILDSLMTESEIVLHAMQPRPGAPEAHLHALNVTVLALILAKGLSILTDDARHLGLGALFHDAGKTRIPDRVLRKTDPLTSAEAALVRQHVEFGARIAAEIGLHEAVVRIIEQHHELCDGSGYPAHLKEAQIDRLARIVSVVNAYENLCNPPNVQDAMTPYEALAHMFARQRKRYDAEILMLFIKTLGIYPPGSLVELSDGGFGTVISVNPNKPLRPYVLMHAPDVPRDTPLLTNLGDVAGLSITRCLRASQLPPDVLRYLAPASRICYFFRPETPECGT
jgi:putative nucleotidyltransferase with HDIG domain